MARAETSAALDTYRAAVDDEMRKALDSRPIGLYQMLRYHLGWTDRDGNPASRVAGGKRLRPILCVTTCRALGGDIKQVIPAAAALELIHNFSLVHDDIEDNSKERYQRPAVWSIWGVAQAINVGDSMHTLARLLLPRMSELGVPVDRVLWAGRLLDEASLQLCEGQFLDMLYQERMDIGLEDYLVMARSKTGALFACAMQLGGIVSIGDTDTVDILGNCGRSFGIAYQILDDLQDMREGQMCGPAATDIVEKKKTYPLVSALASGPAGARKELADIYAKQQLGQNDVERVLAILRGTGSMDKAVAAASHHLDEAEESLSSITMPGRELDVVRHLMHLILDHRR
jgi:geranylgeranyl diphosphate synthase type I